MSNQPTARPEALPLDLLPPLDRNSQIARPNPPGGGQLPVLLGDEATGTASGAQVDLLPSRLLIGKDGQTRSIWPVHRAGWRALGWEVLSPAPADAPEPSPPEPGEPDEPGPEMEEVESGPQDPEQPTAGGLVEVTLALEPAAPQEPEHEESAPENSELTEVDAEPAMEAPDFAAMTKAEIVAFCSDAYGISLDVGMTKAELVEEAAAMHATAAGSAAASQDLPGNLL